MNDFITTYIEKYIIERQVIKTYKNNQLINEITLKSGLHLNSSVKAVYPVKIYLELSMANLK